MSSLNKSMLPSFSASLAIFLARISRITRIFFGEGFRGQGFLVTLVGINDYFLAPRLNPDETKEKKVSWGR